MPYHLPPNLDKKTLLHPPISSLLNLPTPLNLVRSGDLSSITVVSRLLWYTIHGVIVLPLVKDPCKVCKCENPLNLDLSSLPPQLIPLPRPPKLKFRAIALLTYLT